MIVRALNCCSIVDAIEFSKGTDTVNTSQYPADTRKQLKRFQRTPGYQVMKQQHNAEREKLETKLRERNDAIERLKKKLVESGVNAEEVAKLAA
jgi:predicted nuclease with TOPRIM domain